MPRLAECGFWAGGELPQPRQCSIAALEPCCSWGISTNVERTLTAIAFSRSILPALTPESQIVQSSTAGGWAAFRIYHEGSGHLVVPSYRALQYGPPQGHIGPRDLLRGDWQ